jgi:hypothetical protein
LPPRVELTVLNGTAERRTYALAASTRIDLGRCAHVRDSRHRLIRTNHVAFLEGSGDVNQSVSRRHAHISYEPVARCFRLHDDGSEHGTGVVRRGRSSRFPAARGASASSPATRSFSATRACGSGSVKRFSCGRSPVPPCASCPRDAPVRTSHDRSATPFSGWSLHSSTQTHSRTTHPAASRRSGQR